MSRKFTLRKVEGTLAMDEPGNGEPATILISMLDRLGEGVFKLESRLRMAMAGQESGNHVLRVRLDHGRVVKVIHGVEDEM